MKASFKFFLAALAATAALVGCTKEITPNFENDKVNSEGSRVIAVSFAPQTKTTLDGFQPRFEDGKDTVLISNTNALDTCVVSVKDNKATISTNLTGPLTAVYPYKAAKMNEGNENEIDTVLVSTEQSGKFADANICMAVMTSENDESLSFENKTAVFKITPGAGESTQYVEVSADGFDIANCYQTGSAYTSFETIHVATTTADSVYVSILVPENLTVSKLTFSDGTNEKTVTGEKAATAIVAGILYTVTNENWKSPEADIPDGALKGVFSVSADKQVYFSQGNLYAKKDNNGMWNWGFYAKQYQYNSLSTSNSRMARNTDTEIDLFTWGYDGDSTHNSYSLDPINTAGIGGHTTASDNQLNPSTDGDDWGVAYCSSNNITVGTWRTLTTEEWQYLFNSRSTTTNTGTTNARYAKATVDTIAGIILLPDTYTHPSGVAVLTNINTNNAAFTVNTYDVTAWEAMESAGAVFLPAAGCRDGSNVDDVGDYGFYWSSTAYDGNCAYFVYFDSSDVDPVNDGRLFGFSVRLVTNVSAAPTPTEPDYVVMKMGSDQSKELKWAKMNLGAKTIAGNLSTCAGDYYQWGSVNTLYQEIPWDSWNGTDDEIEITSWKDDKSSGFVDANKEYTGNDDLSDATNDVVKKTYPGTNWRMPTKQEFQDLYDACVGADEYDNTTKPTTGKPTSNGVYWCDSYDGVAGVLFYDGTNVLFFPAAGDGNDTDLFGVGFCGSYWSSTFDSASVAYYLYFDGNCGIPQFYSSRLRGFSIRPVSE